VETRYRNVRGSLISRQKGLMDRQELSKSTKSRSFPSRGEKLHGGGILLLVQSFPRKTIFSPGKPYSEWRRPENWRKDRLQIGVRAGQKNRRKRPLVHRQKIGKGRHYKSPWEVRGVDRRMRDRGPGKGYLVVCRACSSFITCRAGLRGIYFYSGMDVIRKCSGSNEEYRSYVSNATGKKSKKTG